MMIRTAIQMAACLLLSNCMPGAWSDGVVRDRIMLVNESPETVGYRQITELAATRPDLVQFFDRHGLPDFIAETASDDRRYVVLYYLKPKHAFALRTWSGTVDPVDFAGPYPMTQKEIQTLSEMKQEFVPQSDTGLSEERFQLPRYD